MAQITSLINTSAENQEKRLIEQMSSVSEDIRAANAAHDLEQATYNEGMGAWLDRSKDIVVGVSKSREGVKTRIKSDFAVSFLYFPFSLRGLC